MVPARTANHGYPISAIKIRADLERHIVNQKSTDFRPETYEDHYERALIDLINSKHAGKPITAKARPRAENVVDLMQAPRMSVGADKSTKRRKASSAAKGNADAH
jgi:DNA end-binding protein Ku